MKIPRAIVTAGIGAVCIVGAAAQSDRNTPGSSTQNPSAQSGTITLSGCLQNGGSAGSQSTPGSSPNSSAAAGTRSFVLMNATDLNSGAAGTTGVAGAGAAARDTGSSTNGSTANNAATGGSAASTAARIYILEGRESDLEKQGGKRVQVNGTVVASTAGGQVSAGISGNTPAAGAAGGSGNASAGTGGQTATGQTPASQSAAGGSSVPAGSAGVGSSMTAAQHVRVTSITTLAQDCSKTP